MMNLVTRGLGDVNLVTAGLGGGYEIRRGGSSDPARSERMNREMIRREDEEIIAIIMAAMEVIE